MTPAQRIFFFGVLGSVALEVVRALSCYNEDKPFPPQYSKRGFWAVRIGLALIGGSLAVAHDVQTAILAFHIGVATPAIIESFVHKLPNSIEPAPRPTAPRKPKSPK